MHGDNMPGTEKDFYKDIIDNLYDGVYFVDRDRVITYWNKGAERITGYTAKQAVGRACRDNLLNHVTANGIQLCETQCPLAAVMEDGREREAEVFVHHANGHRVPIAVRATAMHDAQGNIIGAVESFSNNSSVMDARLKLREMRQVATTDSLTGVGNRKHLEGRLRAAVAEFKSTTSRAGLLFIDVDHFKMVNDSYGHTHGDSVLRMVASTIRYALRATDTVGRWGGEEFLAILYDVKGKNTLRSAAEKVRMLVELSRLDIDGCGVNVTISVGGTLLNPRDTPETIVQRADGFMYQSKRAGRNRVTIG
jgi:diguanylate cyclase (GGDEF)-like protein/PAS domain S-box-containing protein